MTWGLVTAPSHSRSKVSTVNTGYVWKFIAIFLFLVEVGAVMEKLRKACVLY